MYKLLIVVFLLAGSMNSFGQKLLTWDALSDVKFNLKFSPELGMEVTEATFGESLKALKDQQVILKGFMIPLDPLSTKYVLSKYPMANCFFCGQAGPETVVELRMHPNSIRRYPMDEVLSFKGYLRLNEKDATALHYIMEEAERL